MKPILSTFAFSEDSRDVSNNGKGTELHIINPQNVFRPPFIPCTYTFSVTFGVINLDPDRNHTLEFKVTSPTDATVLTTGVLNLNKENNEKDDSFPKEANGFTFNLDFRNVPFKEEGKHHGVLIIDDELIGEIPLLVYARGA